MNITLKYCFYYHGYKLILPSFIQIYAFAALTYIIVTFPRFVQLFPILAVIVVLSLLAVIALLFKVKYNIILDYRNRLRQIRHLLPLRVLCLFTTGVCIYFGFINTKGAYDFSVMEDDVMFADMYEMLTYLEPLVPVPAKNALQVCCDVLQLSCDSTDIVSDLITGYYNTGTEIPESVKESIHTELEIVQARFNHLKFETILHIVILTVDEILHAFTNHLLFRKYKELNLTTG